MTYFNNNSDSYSNGTVEAKKPLSKIIKLIIITLFLLSIFSINLKSQNDFQSWISVNKNIIRKGDWKLNFYAELRSRNNSHEVFGLFWGPTVKYRVFKWLSIGAAVKWIHFKSGKFTKFKRYETEFELKTKLLNKIILKQRYRFEYIDKNESSDRKRIRSRVLFAIPVKNALFSWFTFGNEIFIEKGEIVQNRAIPFSFKFDINQKKSLHISIIWQTFKNQSNSNWVLGITYVH